MDACKIGFVPIERVSVRVHLRAPRQRIEERDGVLHVWVTSQPVSGAANEELLAATGRYFGVPQSAIRIVHGMRSRDKVIEVNVATPNPRPGDAHQTHTARPE
jgi:uncharacterized protein YggU (UPF0235/DUF167 family)